MVTSVSKDHLVEDMCHQSPVATTHWPIAMPTYFSSIHEKHSDAGMPVSFSGVLQLVTVQKGKKSIFCGPLIRVIRIWQIEVT